LTTKKKFPTIKYTSRDFNSIKNDLVEYARRYYPDTFQDFNEAGFGALMLDTVSYVGDILSFYLDYSVNESFLDTSVENDNILRHGRQMGYRFKGNPSSFGIADFYAIIPASSTGLGPDSDYFPFLRRGSQVRSSSGVSFLLNEDISFGKSSNEVVVARVSSQNGNPTHYAVKASGQIMSGEFREEKITVGTFSKFLKISLSSPYITEIVSVTDAEGNEYVEVDYLSQDVVYKASRNTDSNSSTTPARMKEVVAPRRFVIEQLDGTTFIQFGGSNASDTSINPLTNPSQTIIDFHAREFTSDLSFDPTNILGTPSLGVAPANTELTVTYRVNTQSTVNVSANGVSTIVSPIVDFDNISDLDLSKVQEVISSLEVSNEQPINGDVTTPDAEELKIRIYDSFASQKRAVTEQDYRSLVYAMPPQFGAIKRANIVRDPNSFKRNLNIYVISEDANGNLEATNSTIKSNLKTWLNQGRMVNDTIDIIDGKIVNFGIEFTIVGDFETNKFELLSRCIGELENLYQNKLEMGMPFFITDVYNSLNAVDGVVDTVDVKVVNKKGSGYSQTSFNFDNQTSSDGRYINVPSNVVMEIKFPSSDIVGSVK
jgi:hypothetical protein